MWLRAGLCGLSLAILAGCETLPETLTIEIDDRIIEVKRKRVPPGADSAPESAFPVRPDARPQR